MWSVCRYWLVIASLVLTACGSTPTYEPGGLVSKLQQGGYVIYFRHAATDHSQSDTYKDDLSDCRQQRNLSAKGRQQAETIGAAFRALSIPVGDVYSSQLCRCLETAKTAFGKASGTLDITSVMKVDRQERQRRVQAIRTLLATKPGPGRNTVLVSHKHMFTDATSYRLAEGEAAIFIPLGGDKFKLVQQVKADAWMKLK
jgi:broad specificity phosphatase PhoE